ncbi:MAG: hypothetical protein EBU82_10045 [Flavobacteriia bacterium]|nr:hypothetical protein [Flavobacteriia bacterium]
MQTQEELDFENRTTHPQKNVGGKQNARILEHLISGKSITPIEALELYGCFRLAARIHDIKKSGADITCEEIETSKGKRIASYKLNANYTST